MSLKRFDSSSGGLSICLSVFTLHYRYTYITPIMFSLALTPTPLGTGFPLQLDRFNLDDDHDNNMTTTHTEKVEHLSRVDTVVIGDGRKRSVDEAYEYLRNHADNSGAEAINLRQLRRKIDYRIIPLQFFICGLQFLDKFLLNYAIIMGLPEDLKLQGNQLNNIASSLWWAYLITTPFIGLILNKLPLGKFLGGNMFLWGIVIACTAAVKNYPQLIAVRILMGITDAGMPPSLMLMSSQYYRKDEQAMRFAIWFSSVGVAMIAGGLISFGFQFVDSDIMASWRKCPPRFSKEKNSSLTTHHRNHVPRPRSPQLDSRGPLLLETPGLTHDSLIPQRRGKSRINPPRLRQPNRNHIEKIPTPPTPRPLPRPTSLSNFLPHPPRVDRLRNSHRLRHHHHQRLRFHLQRSRSTPHAIRPNRHHHHFSRRLRRALSLSHALDNFHFRLQRLSPRRQSSSFRASFQPRSPTRRRLSRLFLALHRRH